METHSSILAWEIPWTEVLGQATVHGVAKSQTPFSDWVRTCESYSSNLENLTQMVPLPCRCPLSTEGGMSSMEKAWSSKHIGLSCKPASASVCCGGFGQVTYPLLAFVLPTWKCLCSGLLSGPRMVMSGAGMMPHTVLGTSSCPSFSLNASPLAQ